MSIFSNHLIFILNRPRHPIQFASLFDQEVSRLNLMFQGDAIIHPKQNRLTFVQHILSYKFHIIPHPVRLIPCRTNINFFRLFFKVFVFIWILNSELNLPLKQSRRKNGIDNAFHNHAELFIDKYSRTVSTSIIICYQYDNRATIMKFNFNLILVILNRFNLCLQ